jgi:hypothetical protein
MNASHSRLSGFAAPTLAVFAVLFFISAHTPHAPDTARPAPAQQQPYASVAALSPPGALAEMYAYAALHFETFTELPDTFGGTEAWSETWNLHWLDVETGGHVVRIYHLTSKEDARLRFVAIFDDRDGLWTDWQAVY